VRNRPDASHRFDQGIGVCARARARQDMYDMQVSASGRVYHTHTHTQICIIYKSKRTCVEHHSFRRGNLDDISDDDAHR